MYLSIVSSITLAVLVCTQPCADDALGWDHVPVLSSRLQCAWRVQSGDLAGYAGVGNGRRSTYDKVLIDAPIAASFQHGGAIGCKVSGDINSVVRKSLLSGNIVILIKGYLRDRCSPCMFKKDSN